MLREQVHLGFCSSPAISNNVIVVPDNYTKISWAVGNASEGDTIFVKSGVYPESSILVNKTLTIVGENAETTVIDGEDTAPFIFHVIASNVIIKNFTMKNTDPDPSLYSYAIQLYHATNCTVENVIITNVVIGVEIRSSNFTKIMCSRIYESISWGIRVRNASCNNIVGNTFENNPTALYFPDNKSKSNRVYHNNFINNTVEFLYFVNYFDNGYPSGGNYWSDYVATDLCYGPGQNLTGSDGIFDEGYSGDNYPLANPLTSFNILVGGQTFLAQVSTNVTVTTCSLNRSEKSLNLFANGSISSVVACRVLIPKGLLSCENLSDWVISIYNDGGQVPSWSLVLEDVENTYLYFTYNQTAVTNKIMIKGTNVIPEFSWLTIPIILIILTLIIVIAKKVRLTNAQKFKGCTQCLQCLRA